MKGVVRERIEGKRPCILTFLELVDCFCQLIDEVLRLRGGVGGGGGRLHRGGGRTIAAAAAAAAAALVGDGSLVFLGEGRWVHSRQHFEPREEGGGRREEGGAGLRERR